MCVCVCACTPLSLSLSLSLSIYIYIYISREEVRNTGFYSYNMGAEVSQDKGADPNVKDPSSNSSESNGTEAKTHQNTTQVILPHNCEEILKHADSSVDRSSKNKLLEQVYAGVFLNQNKKKYWAERESNYNCFFLFAQDLSITWAEDSRFWHWPLLEESSDGRVPIAELLDVCWLEVHGRFDISNLSRGPTYEVVFVVKLNDPAYGWEVPVNLRLTLPDGSKQEHKEKLMEKPRGKWIEIAAGEFKTTVEEAGEMEFSLYEYEGGKWKRGLLIKGVSIRPKASVK
ncbi:uncharacterized protein PHLOEM PROTEIN 2-LIKE A4-like [Andrographis paniculata]|uniref:uncharacterized protein PHLOEM PROTEIN 2-LIKE A4-like n=1 Tax=Andrographis paniculata TaxID=175694 RepID=UPI0021E873D6|nr:uncharacterized protein PHLOEM PROTEIN 2-LIKE A4-like [Andrographis paniculata]